MQNKLIVLEGLDYSGKSTIIERLKSEKELQNVLFTHEPGGEPIADEIATILNQHGRTINPLTKTYLFASARHELIQKVLIPKLENQTIILDRFIASTYAYQHGGDKYPLIELTDITRHVCANMPTIDLTIYLDISMETFITRQQKRTEKYDSLDSYKYEYYQNVKRFYPTAIELSETKKSVTVDANQSIDTVYKNVLDAIKKELRI